MSVPPALRAIVGKQEFYATISATSDAQARRKLPAIVGGFQATIDAARAEAKAGRVQAPPRRGRSLTPRQMAVADYAGELAIDDQVRNAGIYKPEHREWSKASYAAEFDQRVASGAAP